MRWAACLCFALIHATIAFGQSDTTVCRELGLSLGWNAVSLPVAVSDQSAMANFGVPYLYEFIVEPWTGYRPVDKLEYGRSYWIKNEVSRSVCFTGKLRVADTLDVHAGWNFIGSLSRSFVPDTTTLRVIPSGSVHAYVIGLTCDPGPCPVMPGWGFLARITSDAPNPKLVMRVR